MKRTKRIKNILKKYFDDFSIVVIDNSELHKGHNNFDGGNETHICLDILNNSKLKLNKLEIHRKINFLLKEEFENGLHSLEIKIN